MEQISLGHSPTNRVKGNDFGAAAQGLNRDLQTLVPSCLTIHQVRPADQDCKFNTKEVSSEVLRSTFSQYIIFSNPYTAPPRVYQINMSASRNIRIKTYANEVLPDRFLIHIDSWAGSILYSAGSTWFVVAGNDFDYQFGSFNTLEDHSWDEPQAITNRRIEFVRPYDCAEVVVWLDCLNIDRNWYWHVRATANEIDSTGFTLQKGVGQLCLVWWGRVVDRISSMERWSC